VLLQGGLQELRVAVALRARDAGPKGLVGHRPNGRESLGDGVAVTAVRAGDVVVGTQDAARPDGRRLLADRDVRRAAIVVAGEGIVATGAEADDHLFQLADGEHVVEQVEGVRPGNASARQLGGEIAGVGKAGDRGAGLLEGREVRSGVAAVGRLGGHGLPPGAHRGLVDRDDGILLMR